jgi:hypothetical protein
MGGQHKDESWENIFFGCGLDLTGSEWGHLAGSCEHGDESPGSIKCGEILD